MVRLRRNKVVIAVLVLPALIVYTFVLPYPLVRTAYARYQLQPAEPGALHRPVQFYDAVHGRPGVQHSAIKHVLPGDRVYHPATSNCLHPRLLAQHEQAPLYEVFQERILLPGRYLRCSRRPDWQFLYQPKLGIVDEVVRLLSFHSFQFAWLANRSAAIWAVVIAVSWQYFGYHLLIFTAPKWTSTPSSLAKHMHRQGTGAATAPSSCRKLSAQPGPGLGWACPWL